MLRRKRLERSAKPMKCTGFRVKTPYEGMTKEAKTFQGKPRKPIKRISARGREWSRAWQFLKDQFYQTGRTHCEFDFIPHDCWGALYPCHSKKRRKMQGHDIYAVALGCQQIARWLDESLDHEAMEQAVWKAIANHGGIILPHAQES